MERIGCPGLLLCIHIYLGFTVYLNCLDYMGDMESKAALKSGRLPSSLSSSARPISISLPFITLISFFYIYV